MSEVLTDEIKNILSATPVFKVICENENEFIDELSTNAVNMYDYVDQKPLLEETKMWYHNKKTMYDKCLEIDTVMKTIEDIKKNQPTKESVTLITHNLPSPSLIYLHTILIIYLEIKTYLGIYQVKIPRTDLLQASEDYYRYIRHFRDREPKVPYQEFCNNGLTKWMIQNPDKKIFFSSTQVCNSNLFKSRLYHGVNIKRKVNEYYFVNVYRF